MMKTEKHGQAGLTVGILAVTLLGMLGTALPAQASSEAAWQGQRDRLVERCTAKAQRQQPGRYTVTVDPFGSQSYAMAVVTRTSRVNGKLSRENMICVMDKRTSRLELGGELPELPAWR